MKSLDLATMENIQGGQLPNLPINDVIALVSGLISGILATGLGAVGNTETLLKDLLGSLSGIGGLGALGGL